MREENILYEALYESLLTQLYSGVFRYGEKFPSQQQICRRYNVGITTVRKVMGMLEENGFLRSAPGRRAEVCFRGDDAAYAACLLQRRAAIGDVYLGLEVLMPALYAEGARRCPDPTRLRAGLESIRPGMSGSEACGRAAEYLTQMLLPFRNPVLLDLQADMEHYVRVPALSLPGPTGSPDVAADYAKARLSAFQDLIEQGRTADAEAWLVQMYRKAGRRADRYLGQVQRQCPPAGEELPYRWFSCKGRAHLYTVVARSLYRRALAGEFAEDAYLPSVPVLMQTYGVSKSTACAAVALLSDIGFVRTLDKKGSVLRQGGELPPLRLERNVIDEQLILFLDALQILAVCAKPLTLAVFSAQTAPPPPPPAKPPAGHRPAGGFGYAANWVRGPFPVWRQEMTGCGVRAPAAPKRRGRSCAAAKNPPGRWTRFSGAPRWGGRGAWGRRRRCGPSPWRRCCPRWPRAGSPGPP